jgi:hypothetical protein
LVLNEGTLRQRRKKVTRSFKIEDTLDNAITTKAKKIGITPSSFVSQILRRHIDWVQYIGTGTTFLTIDKEIFVSFLEEMSEDRLVEIARSSSLVSALNFLKFRYQKINFDNVMDFLETLSSNSNIGETNIVIDEDGRNLEINVRHSLGMKWSIFFSEYISGILSSFLELRAETEVSQLGCTITTVRPKRDTSIPT